VLVESSADKTVSESAVALQASVPSKPRGKATLNAVTGQHRHVTYWILTVLTARS
jgi:hypothetical protein